MAERMATLGRYATLAQAEAIRGLLESEGIRAVVGDAATGTTLGFGVGGVTPSVLVWQTDLERARTVVDDDAKHAEEPTPEEVEEALRAAGAYDGEPQADGDADAKDPRPTEDAAVDTGGEMWARRLRFLALGGFLIGLCALGALLWSLQPPEKVVLSQRALSMRFQARALAWSALGVHVLLAILLQLLPVD